jgi:hypothetical protein
LVGVIDLLRIMSRVAASDNSFQLATWVLREFGRSNSKFKVKVENNLLGPSSERFLHSGSSIERSYLSYHPEKVAGLN